MNRNYQKGYRFERRIIEDLKRQGFCLVLRSAGSHSPVDVIALSSLGDVHLVQCKAGLFNFTILKEAIGYLNSIPDTPNFYKWVAYTEKGRIVYISTRDYKCSEIKTV
jgi:hypothetical protein